MIRPSCPVCHKHVFGGTSEDFRLHLRKHDLIWVQAVAAEITPTPALADVAPVEMLINDQALFCHVEYFELYQSLRLCCAWWPQEPKLDISQLRPIFRTWLTRFWLDKEAFAVHQVLRRACGSPVALTLGETRELLNRTADFFDLPRFWA
jgi:hypothetical protein